MNKSPLLLLFVFLVVLLLYYPALSVYFSQDDFFHFKASQTDGSIPEFIKLFGFPSFEERGYGFYRPIFREALHNIYYSLFGLNVLPFRVFSFILHFINISLVWFLMQTLFKRTGLPLFVAFFFGISAANIAVLYYLAGGIEILGATLFLLLSSIFFLKYLEGDGAKNRTLSFIFFLLGLASHEQAAVTPFVLAGLIFTKVPLKNLGPRLVKELWQFFLIWVVYLYLDVVKIGFLQKEQQYEIVFSIQKTVNSLAWYVVWALGTPEMLVDFVRPGLKLNPSLMRYWGEYFRVIFATFFVSIAFITGSIGWLFLYKRKIFQDKKFWLLFFWFPLSILPVVFLPLHKSTYYLAPALPAFWGIVGILLFSTYRELKKRCPRLSFILFGAATMSLFILSVASIGLGHSTYPAATRGRISEKLAYEVYIKYPTVPIGSAIYFENDPEYPFVAKDWGGTSKQAAFVLNNEDALQLLYKDPTLRVFYEDLGGVPPDFPEDRVYSLVARIQ